MDVRISAGDVFLDASGSTQYISSAQEAAQRALIAASAVKGSFRYNRALGTDYASLTDTERLTERLDMLVREATASIANTEVRIIGSDIERQTAVMAISHGGTTITTEVDLHGIL